MQKGYFTKGEWALWLSSAALICGTFFLWGDGDLLHLSASLIGVTSLILNAKGNPIGQLLMIVFSLLYGIVSFRCRYYGEMITYVGMTMPMAAAALVSWLRHPYRGRRAEVAVGRMGKRQWIEMWVLAVPVTVGFYFILAAFHTANLLASTLSVTTSFLAVYLTFRRSPWYAVAYAANDLVLIVLWVLASLTDSAYVSVVVCFVVFFVNDVYGFISWRRMERRQAE